MIITSQSSLSELTDAIIVALGVDGHIAEPFARKILDVASKSILEMKTQIDDTYTFNRDKE